MKTYSRHDFTREERAARAKVAISAAFESKEQAFLDFVLSHYVRVGVQELDQEKLTPLLRLKYNNSIADAVAHLGKPEDIGRVFIGFQKYLYQQEARFPRVSLYDPDRLRFIQNTLGTKAEAWQHEEEWRLIANGRSGIIRMPMWMIDGIVLAP